MDWASRTNELREVPILFLVISFCGDGSKMWSADQNRKHLKHQIRDNFATVPKNARNFLRLSLSRRSLLRGVRLYARYCNVIYPGELLVSFSVTVSSNNTAQFDSSCCIVLFLGATVVKYYLPYCKTSFCVSRISNIT